MTADGQSNMKSWLLPRRERFIVIYDLNIEGNFNSKENRNLRNIFTNRVMQ